MATIAFARPSHPAMSFGYPTPPSSPIFPSTVTPSTKRSHLAVAAPTVSKPHAQKSPATQPQPPKVNYALLRSHHVTALKYVMGKIRWEQANNSYLHGESAWTEHNNMIKKLEDELKSVEAAQKTLAKFPTFCHAPTAPLESKPYGPKTKEQYEKDKADAEKKEKELDLEIEKQFPFIKQLFIGPMTKQQARNDRLLRRALKAGDLMDITELLPSENLRMALNGAGQGEKKPEKKRSWHHCRMVREQERIDVILEAEAARIAKLSPSPSEKKARIGPLTKEEHLASLPVFGPKARAEALLPIQREQRHVILNFLRKPWPQYDDEAAALMERMGRLAIKRLNQEAEVKEREAEKKAEKKEAKEA